MQEVRCRGPPDRHAAQVMSERKHLVVAHTENVVQSVVFRCRKG
jgi:hypothetical protein